MARVVVTACLVVALGMTGNAQEKIPARPFAAGEVIVKFSAVSPVGAQIERAASESDEPGEAIRAAVRGLSTELGIGLEPKRLGSGGTLLLSIRTTDLPQTIAARLRRQRSVKDAQAVPKTPGAVVVELASGSPDAATWATTASGDRTTAARTIATRLESLIGLPLTGRADDAGRLILTPEMSRYTLQLVERLRERADVEYAQPNYLDRLRNALDR